MAKGNKKKKVKQGSNPSPSKKPKEIVVLKDGLERVDSHLMDWGGPFSWEKAVPEWNSIHRRINDMRGLSLTELIKGGSHNIPVGDLSKPARDRLLEIELDDTDELFSLRLKGKERAFGIKDRSTLKLIWYDPDHEVCPSNKKGN